MKFYRPKMTNVEEEYLSSLSDLTINSKPLINMLTMLAEDYIDHAEKIVGIVDSHIRKVEANVKLPVLYLIDSIVKNVGKDYITHFTKVLVPLFCGVFETVDEKTRSQMFKVRQTWGDFFSSKKLYALDARVNALDPAWPILTPLSSVHVNPKFLKKEDGAVREQLLKRQKELLELQQKKVELELLQTKAMLEESQKKLDVSVKEEVVKEDLVLVSRDPRLRKEEKAEVEVKELEAPVLAEVEPKPASPVLEPMDSVPSPPSPPKLSPKRKSKRKEKRVKRPKLDVDLRSLPLEPPQPPTLFGNQDIDLRREETWASLKKTPETPKPPRRPSTLRPKPIFEDRSRQNCNLIIKQAEEELSSGNISFAQYNRTLKEVMTINEGQKLNQAKLKYDKSKFNRNDLPPAEATVLDLINLDPVHLITIDGHNLEVRFYGEVAVAISSWDVPREISFTSGGTYLNIDSEKFYLQFNAPYKEINLGVKIKVRLGCPTRELYIDGKFYHLQFGGSAVQIDIAGSPRAVSLDPPTPDVCLGKPRPDLIVGKINLIVDGKTIFPIFLDAKPQKFEMGGLPFILRFVERLTKVVINGIPFSFNYGGIPVRIFVNGECHYLRLTVLPKGVVPGMVKILNMEDSRVATPPPPPIISTTGDEELEMLSTMLPSEQPSSGVYASAPETPLSVTELFQKLVAVGIVKNEDAHPQPELSFSQPESLKLKNTSLPKILYSGIQCNSCGCRFSAEDTRKYSDHLDMHFRQNRRNRNKTRVAKSRSWYYEISDWVLYQEIEFQEERGKSAFEIDQSTPVEETPLPYLSVDTFPGPPTCKACQDEFEQVYSEDLEVWQYKNCILENSNIFHPSCFENYKETEVAPEPVVETEEVIEVADEDEKVESPKIEPEIDEDILHIEELKPTIISYNLVDDDEELDLTPIDRPIEEDILLDTTIKIKQEKVDIPAPIQDHVKPSIDGNLEFQELSRPVINRIKINLAPSREEPPPPGEEIIPPLKAGLIGRKLEIKEPISKGKELSSLCCIQ